MSIAELTAIVRERYDSGAYGGTHRFEMTRSTWELIKAAFPPDPSPRWSPHLGGMDLGGLMAIPVRFVEDVPHGEWVLTQAAGVARRGRIE